MILEKFDLILACKAFVTDWCDDLDLRCKDFKYDIETYLVITCSCTSVSHCTCADLLYMLEDLESLEYSL